MPKVLGWISEWLDVRDNLTNTDALVIDPRTGTPLTYNGIRVVYTKGITKYFSQHVTSHMMRHTMVKLMRVRGASDDYIMSKGGWSDRKTFKDFYDCLDLDDIDEGLFAFGLTTGSKQMPRRDMRSHPDDTEGDGRKPLP